MNASQRGMVIGGIWLIALGGVFLVQQIMDLPWSQAWPLFIVAAGIGTGASTLLALVGRATNWWALMWALIWPLAGIIIGGLVFVDLAGLADIDALGILGGWWPVLLIVLGVLVLLGAVLPRARGIEESVSVSSSGLSSGEVVLKFGGGELNIGPGPSGTLVGGTFEGGVIRRDVGPGRVELETDITQVMPWVGQRIHWRVGLDPDIPIALRVEGGASRSILDLADLRVTALTVKTGASDTRITLPRNVERCDVRIEAGAAQVNVEVPDGVAARIHAQMGLGSSSVDEARFPRFGNGWESPDFATAANRAEITVSGGVGSVRVR